MPRCALPIGEFETGILNWRMHTHSVCSMVTRQERRPVLHLVDVA